MKIAITKRGYLVAFGIVMCINLVVGTYLLKTVVAQTSDVIKQKALDVEISVQLDAPLLISVGNVTNSKKDFQTISYVGHNTSSKPIRAYVMVQKDSLGLGKTITNYFYPVFAAGHTITNSISIERPNVKPDAKVFLAIDYVQFADGTFWGADVDRQSESIYGYVEGYKHACSNVKRILGEKNDNVLLGLLTQDITAINPPAVDQTKSDLWQRGFVLGFRSLISKLQTTFGQKGIEEVSKKIADLSKLEEHEEK